MRTEENKSIAYIYDEMDPSEKLEFERGMSNDSDLLIEVESLKKISQKLNQLDPINPPDHVVDTVIQSAKRRKYRSKKYKFQPLIFSAAAILLVGLTSGILLIEDPVSSGTPDQSGETASIGNSGNQLYSRPARPVLDTNERLDPWIDENEVLYFQEQTASQNSMMDSIRTASLEKLTPVDPTNVIQRQQQLQLTGNQN